MLYILLAEGLADWVAKQLCPEREVKYQAGYRPMKLLVAADKEAISDLLRLNYLLLLPEDVDNILTSPTWLAYFHELLSRMAGCIRGSLRAAIEAGITDPTFVPLGEELRAWKFLLERRFERERKEVYEVVRKWVGTGGDKSWMKPSLPSSMCLALMGVFK